VHRSGDSRQIHTAELVFGIHPVLEALRAKRRSFVRVSIRRGARDLEPIRSAARAAGVEIREVESADLVRSLPAGSRDQGVLLEAGPLPNPGLQEIAKQRKLLVALDGVEDPQNVGSLIRVAEAAGAGGMILTERRAPSLSSAVAKASAGAVEWLPVSRVVNLLRSLRELKERGFWIYGGVGEGSVDVLRADPADLPLPAVLVLGGEGAGLRRSTRAGLDVELAIPMSGKVGSLNVATAGAVLLFYLRRAELLAVPR
jgi:23S rRNA (guanosine2251-2'-O)-methyltransferase